MPETAYTLDDIREKAQYFGEFMLVLESDREYDFHNFTVTFGDESDAPALAANEFRVEGLHEDERGDTEHVVVDVPVGRVEHVYAHREA